MAKITKINGEDYITYAMHYSKSGAESDAKMLKELGFKTAIRKKAHKTYDGKVLRSEMLYFIYRIKTK